MQRKTPVRSVDPEFTIQLLWHIIPHLLAG